MRREIPAWATYLGLGVSLVGLVLRLSDRQSPTAPVPWGLLTASETARQHGLDNNPGPGARRSLEALYRKLLTPIATNVGGYRITSGYRSEAVNQAVGGAPGSQHVKGEAADLAFDNLTAIEAAKRLHESGLEADQVIVYAKRGHLHVSYTTRRRNRRVFLIDHENGQPLQPIPWAHGQGVANA